MGVHYTKEAIRNGQKERGEVGEGLEVKICTNQLSIVHESD